MKAVDWTAKTFGRRLKTFGRMAKTFGRTVKVIDMMVVAVVGWRQNFVQCRQILVLRRRQPTKWSVVVVDEMSRNSKRTT